MADYDSYVARLRAALTPPDLEAMIRYATLAANSHNTQPWRFKVEDRAIEIRPDFGRRTPAVDPDNHHLFVSLGCAATNLMLAGAAAGRPGEISRAPDGGGLRYDYVSGVPRTNNLFASIVRRQSTRAEYDGRAVPNSHLIEMERAASITGVTVALVLDRGRIKRVRDLVLEGNTAQMGDAAFMAEFKRWLRFNPRSAMASGDGLFSAASGNPVLPNFLGSVAFDRLFNSNSENAK